MFAPSLNVTVPVGLPPVVTVAVNITACPNLEGFRLEATDVLLGYLFTTCFSNGEVLAMLFTSPAYVAAIERLPDVLNEVLTLACPFTRLAEPSETEPDLKTTFPLTMPRYLLVTVAV